jgi:hypothetical protein
VAHGAVIVLYALTVICTIYRLKDRGVKLGYEAVQQTAMRGELLLTRKRPSGMPIIEAVLYSDSGKVLDHLSQAEVRRIDKDGMLIRGYEYPAQVQLVPQVWWCVPEAQQNP